MTVFFSAQIRPRETDYERKANRNRHTCRTRSKPLFVRLCEAIIFLGGTTVGHTDGHTSGHTNRHARASV